MEAVATAAWALAVALLVVTALRQGRHDVLVVTIAGALTLIVAMTFLAESRRDGGPKRESRRWPEVYRADRTTRRRVTRAVHRGQHLEGTDTALATDYASWLVRGVWKGLRSFVLGAGTGLLLALLLVDDLPSGDRWIATVPVVVWALALPVFGYNYVLARRGKRYLERLESP